MTEVARDRIRLAILIPAYNCEGTIGQTLASLQAVTAGWEHVSEVLVCDDRSSDGSVAAVEASAFDRCPLRVLRHETNKGEGTCYATMAAALAPDVNWFMILHADDLVLANFVERNMEIARRCPKRAAAVSSNYYVFGDGPERLAHEAEDVIVWRGGAHEEIMHTALVGTWWHISGSLVNRRLWVEYGGRDTHLPQLGDWDLMLRWQQDDYLVGHSLIPTTKYRTGVQSVSSQSYLQFRDLRERVTVIGRHPRIFTRAMRLKTAWGVARAAARRIAKLALRGKIAHAVRGAGVSGACILSLSTR